jgi:hypothetical protein
MLAYNIWTWTAIAALAFGSIAVFVVFLVTTWRQLRAERKPAAKPSAQKITKTP